MTAPGAGFDVDTNQVELFTRDGRHVAVPLAPKSRGSRTAFSTRLSPRSGGATAGGTVARGTAAPGRRHRPAGARTARLGAPQPLAGLRAAERAAGAGADRRPGAVATACTVGAFDITHPAGSSAGGGFPRLGSSRDGFDRSSVA